MKNIFGIAVATALLLTTPRAAEAELVTGFNLGAPSTTSIGGGAVTITSYPVLTTNDLADNSSSPVVTSINASGDVVTTFSGSFASDDRLDLMWFDFRGQAEETKTASWEATIKAGNSSVTKSGSFSGSATVSQEVDLSELVFVRTGSVELTLTDGMLMDDGTSLPRTNFTGFAAISGQPTAIPEPSTVAGLALLSGVGLLVHRRRRVAKLG